MLIELLLLIVFVLVLSFAVYWVAQFSTKETPFEEAIAEQRHSKPLDILYPSKVDKVQKKVKPQVKKIKPRRDDHSHGKSQKDAVAPVHKPKKPVSSQPDKDLTDTITQKKTENTLLNKLIKADRDQSRKEKDGKHEAKENLIAEKAKPEVKKANKKEENPKKVESKKTENVKPSPKAETSAPKPQDQGKGKKNEKNGTISNQIDAPKSKKDSTHTPKAEPAKTKKTDSVHQQKPIESFIAKTKCENVTKSTPSTIIDPSQTKSTESPKPRREQKGSNASTPKKENVSNGPMSIQVIEEKRVEEELLVVLGDEMGSPDSAPTFNHEKKKKKKEEEKKKMLSLADDALSRIMPMIQKSNLSVAEIQTLIETLLNKKDMSGGKGGGEWVAKGAKVDPVSQLKKQLEDAETRIRDQTDAQEALSAKIVDLRTDLNTERQKSNVLKKQLDSSMSIAQQKIDAAATAQKDQLNAQLNEAKTVLNTEYQVAIQRQQSSRVEMETQLKTVQGSLGEVENQLQQAVSKQIEAETQFQHANTALNETQQQLQASTKDRDELVGTCQQYQSHLVSLQEQSEEREQSLNARLFETQQNLSASEASHSQAVAQLTQVATEKDLLAQQIQSLENAREVLSQTQVKLKKAIQEKSELENRLSQTESELTRHKESIDDQKAEIECLKEEKESLATQSVRPAAEGQENGDTHTEHKHLNHNSLPEENLGTLTKEITRLKEESSRLRTINDDGERSLEQIAANTKAVFIRIFPALSAKEYLDHSSFLKEAESVSIAAKAQPVVEVQTKVVEKLVQDPKLIQQLEEIRKENQELHRKAKEDSQCVEKRLEGIQKENEELHRKITSLQDENSSLLANISSKADDNDSSAVIAQLQVDNKSLAEKVVHYQEILANTESLLKSLQKSVETEESTWHDKIVEKEEQVKGLAVEKANLHLKVNELNSALEKVKQAEEMESQLNTMKEKLCVEEADKGRIKDELVRVQEQLNLANGTASTNGPPNGVSCHEGANNSVAE